MSGKGRKTIVAGAAAALAVVALAAAILLVSGYIGRKAEPYVYEEMARLPYRDVGLVLGTSRGSSTHLNEFYLARIAAAAELFHAGKIGHIIVSGSNPSRYYNEPLVMKQDLMAKAVPASSITEDYAGLRTLDSVVRADKVMGQKAFTIISQRFHAERAVFLGLHFGLDVVGYCAEAPTGLPEYGARVREYGARCKALLDIKVLNTQPKHLGEPISIELQPRPASGAAAQD